MWKGWEYWWLNWFEGGKGESGLKYFLMVIYIQHPKWFYTRKEKTQNYIKSYFKIFIFYLKKKKKNFHFQSIYFFQLCDQPKRNILLQFLVIIRTGLHKGTIISVVGQLSPTCCPSHIFKYLNLINHFVVFRHFLTNQPFGWLISAIFIMTSFNLPLIKLPSL